MCANGCGVERLQCGTAASVAGRWHRAVLQTAVLGIISGLALAASMATSASAQTVTQAPVALSFGVPSGSTYTVAPSTYPGSAPEVVTVTIVGASASNPVTFTPGATVTGTNSADFIIDGNACTGTFTSPNTCQLTLHFNASKAPANTLETALLTISRARVREP